MKTFPHDLDLGGAVDPGSLRVLLQNNRDSELLRGILQLLRNHAANLERTGRWPASGANSLEYRAYHAGGADATEEILLNLYAWAHPESSEQPGIPPGMESELDEA